MTEDEIEMLNAQFAQVYARDAELRAALREDVDQLTVL